MIRMKAVIIESKNESKIIDIPIKTTGADEILIKIAYVGICSTDIEIFEGNLCYYKKKLAKYPIIPGHEFSGIVQEAGKNVKGFKKGDKVTAECSIGCGECIHCQNGMEYICKKRKEVGVLNKDGAYAQFMTINQRYVYKIPPKIGLKEGTLIEPTAVVIKSLRKISPLSTDRILIIGAGPMGDLCSQILSKKNPNVHVLDINENRLKHLNKNVKGMTSADFNDYDYIVEATGVSSLLKEVILQSKENSTILLIGIYNSNMDINLSKVVCYDKTILGSVSSQKRDWIEAIDMIDKGRINVGKYVQKTFPLDEYKKAINIHKSKEFLKILLEVD